MVLIYFPIVCGLISLYLYLTRNFNYWKNRNVEYIKPRLIAGNIYKVLMLKQTIGGCMQVLYNSSKSAFVGFFIFDRPALLIRDPQIIKQCLIKDFENFYNRAITEDIHTDAVGSNMLFLKKQPGWKELRAHISPAFSVGRLKGMLPLIVQASNDLTGYIRNVVIHKMFVDCRDISMKFTTDVIASCAFGVNANSFTETNADFRQASSKVFDWNLKRTVETIAFFLAPFFVRLLGLRFIDKATSDFLRRILLLTMNERERSNYYRADLLDTLIQLKQGTNFGNDKVIGTAALFFIAGFETTGTTTSYALYELALNQQIQDRLRNEILAVVYKHGNVTYDAIKEMHYLNMVISETLRKYPALPFLDRECTKPYQLPGTDVIIEKGIPVYISLLGLHYDEELFPQPYKFDPERFSIENKAKMGSYIYMPFGEGRRNCLGRKFGLMVVQVALIQIIGQFKVVVSDNTPIPANFSTRGFLIGPQKKLNLKLIAYSKAPVD